MRTVGDTPDRLVITDAPRIFPGILCAAAALLSYGAVTAGPGDLAGRTGMALTGLVMLAAAWAFFPTRVIAFDRSAGIMARESRRLGRTRNRAVPLGTTRRAAIQIDRSDDGPTERLVLITEDGPLPLESGFTSSPRHAAAASINAWLGVAA